MRAVPPHVGHQFSLASKGVAFGWRIGTAHPGQFTTTGYRSRYTARTSAGVASVMVNLDGVVVMLETLHPEGDIVQAPWYGDVPEDSSSYRLTIGAG